MEPNEPDPMEELLRAELHAPDFPADEVHARIRRTIAGGGRRSSEAGRVRRSSRAAEWTGSSRIPRWAAAVAAALLLFVAGAEYGRRSAVSTVGEMAAVREGALGLPLAIQASGSDYVARLAELTIPASALSERDRQLAREVAWATLRGAMVELARQSEGDETLRAMIRLAGSRSDGVDDGRAGTVLRF